MTTSPTALTTAALTPADYTWRPLRRADLPAVHTLVLAIAAADQLERVETLADLENGFVDPWSDPEVDARVILAPDGSLAAFVQCFAHPEPEHEAVAWLRFDLHPAHRGRGLEDAMLDWLEARSTERLRATAPNLPRSIRSSAPDTVTHEIALLERHGFQPIRYFYRMRRDLRQPLPEPSGVFAAGGLTLRRYSPDLDQALYQAHNEAFADHWGYQPETPEDWRDLIIGHPGFRPDLTLVALDGDQVAAYTLNRVLTDGLSADSKPFGYLDKVGTRRSWRKRGLATALMGEAMRLFRAEGLDEAYLGVDAHNPTGALGVYERLGFVSVRRFIALGKTIP